MLWFPHSRFIQQNFNFFGDQYTGCTNKNFRSSVNQAEEQLFLVHPLQYEATLWIENIVSGTYVNV